jgi:hypothetical protein
MMDSDDMASESEGLQPGIELAIESFRSACAAICKYEKDA